MSKLKVLDLFSGIGGFSLGLERTGGFETVAFCEIEEFPRKVLKKHWPTIPCFEDVRKLKVSDVGTVDVITGGFPCQDISIAGSGKGIVGARSSLWLEFFRLIRDLRPKYAIVENSAALLYRGLDQLLSNLATIRYNAEWHGIRASAIGCPFEGDRIYLIASPDEINGQKRVGFCTPIIDSRALLKSYIEHRSSIWMEAACRSGGVDNGFSDFVDRRQRTEGLGNAVVPQVVEMIGYAILESLAKQNSGAMIEKKKPERVTPAS